MTAITSLSGQFRPAHERLKTQYRRYRLAYRPRGRGHRKGPAMLSIVVIAAVIAALVAVLGLPYGQTWYARWNPPR
ncbi:hypothetical protein MDUV_10750 [Mycolicibacterium duvalii]|uniref:Uncharacterized protein n=1 Tax=Mycolicibacterium duvalii TaxID=39688 RepID=A0A7I7JWL5_9MYCO|nr:hypothetical protein MDUV_10750 [Mycolicibacterium duvalii]